MVRISTIVAFQIAESPAHDLERRRLSEARHKQRYFIPVVPKLFGDVNFFFVFIKSNQIHQILADISGI